MPIRAPFLGDAVDGFFLPPYGDPLETVFTPSLDILDALVESITITENEEISHENQTNHHFMHHPDRHAFCM